MAEPSEHADTNSDQQVLGDTLNQLDALLVDLRENVGDPAALGVIVQNLVALVEGGLAGLAGMEPVPEAKAQMVRLRGQITELEQLLHNHQSILSGFSVYLKELVEG
ncbi:hypothetical protein [Seohaeicola sp.]|uniref:hypothetical protein n=1 Tax=Seohaeicola sp. TaxID=2042026 RepID=UPI003A8952ED